MDNNNKPARPDRHGSNNPMFQRHHSQATRQQMSKSHLQYQEKVRRAMKDNQQHPMTMDEFLESSELKECLTRIIKDELQKLQL